MQIPGASTPVGLASTTLCGVGDGTSTVSWVSGNVSAKSSRPRSAPAPIGHHRTPATNTPAGSALTALCGVGDGTPTANWGSVTKLNEEGPPRSAPAIGYTL